MVAVLDVVIVGTNVSPAGVLFGVVKKNDKSAIIVENPVFPMPKDNGFTMVNFPPFILGYAGRKSYEVTIPSNEVYGILSAEEEIRDAYNSFIAKVLYDIDSPTIVKPDSVN